MGGILAGLFSSLLGGGLTAITGQIAQAYKDKLAAENDVERIAADERIKTLQAQRDVLVAEVGQGGWASWIRPAFATLFLAYNAKLIVWDTMLGWGSTPPLSEHLYTIEGLVIGSYFISRGIEKTARILRG